MTRARIRKISKREVLLKRYHSWIYGSAYQASPEFVPLGFQGSPPRGRRYIEGDFKSFQLLIDGNISTKPKASWHQFQIMISLIFAMVVATFAVSSAHPMEKRQANGRWSLYAYGRNIDEFPIFYADGKYLLLLKRSLLILFA